MHNAALNTVLYILHCTCVQGKSMQCFCAVCVCVLNPEVLLLDVSTVLRSVAFDLD